MDENRTNRDLIMKLACMISYVLRRWKVVLLIVLIGAMGFDTVHTLMYHPRYQASVSATLGAEENTYSQLETTRAYIRSLDYIFNGQNVQSYLQERLGREDADLTCSVNSVNDTNLVNISVQADTRRDAWFGLQYMLEWYRTNGDKYHFTYDLNVTQTNPISEAPVSANSNSRNLMMGGIGGGVLLQQHEAAGRLIGFPQAEDALGQLFLAQRLQQLRFRLAAGRCALQRKDSVAGGVHPARPCAAQVVLRFVGGDAGQPLILVPDRTAAHVPPRGEEGLLR